MSDKKIYVIGGLALILFLMRGKGNANPVAGGMGSGGGNGTIVPPNNTTTFGTITTIGTEPGILSDFVKGQYAEFTRIRDAAITPTSTIKNHYDWIQPIWLTVGGYMNNSAPESEKPLIQPLMNEMKSYLDSIHSQAYPSYIQKQAGAIGEFVLNKLKN
jgi:hypothetical protein